MKIVGVSLILAGVLHMFYNNIIIGNFNLDGFIIFVGIMIMWYELGKNKKRFIRKGLFD